MNTLKIVNYVISVVFTVCYSYQFFYIAFVLWQRWQERRSHEIPDAVSELHRFAILICGRNEEAVIGDLLETIHGQSYPQELLTTFVMVDNCSDETAAVARAHGAVVYCRKDTEHVGKGYALDLLLKCIARDFEPFDGYFVFDADNILSSDYIAEMDKTFSSGHEIITNYRNSKNYGSNWISAGYGLWFLRESRYLNYARFSLGTSCAVSGTGFFFSQRVADATGGWPFHLLTEDIEFSIDRITANEKIAFCEKAILYDEQPVDFRQSWHQRLRWSRGYLQVFGKYGGKLLRGIISGCKNAECQTSAELRRPSNQFSCFDMCMTIMPAFVLSTISLFCNVVMAIWGAVCGEDVMIAVSSLGELVRNGYLMLFVLGAVTTMTEWKQIQTSGPRKIFYMLTFPLFMLTYIPIAFASFFCRPEWKPIVHTMSVKKLREKGITIR